MGWEGGELLGYSRVLPAGFSYEESSIGRIVSSPAARGEGLGASCWSRVSIPYIGYLENRIYGSARSTI
ncbi:hypothetical protein ACQ86N_38805 [Puia sp. P3]|uniref:hypothetical protein n=1 Tax=Puia sp. P3 TaxID=3423952 RepID=UPI003D668692